MAETILEIKSEEAGDFPEMALVDWRNLVTHSDLPVSSSFERRVSPNCPRTRPHSLPLLLRDDQIGNRSNFSASEPPRRTGFQSRLSPIEIEPFRI